MVFLCFYLIAVGLIILIDILVILQAVLHRHLANQIAKPAKSNDGGKPKTSYLTVNPPALQQAQSVPAPGPATPAATPANPATAFLQQLQPLLPLGAAGVFHQLHSLIPPGSEFVLQQLQPLIPPGSSTVLQQLQPLLPSSNPQAPLQQEQGLQPSSFAPAAFQRRQRFPPPRGRRRRPPNVTPLAGFHTGRPASNAPRLSARNTPPGRQTTPVPSNPDPAIKFNNLPHPPQTFPLVGSVLSEPPGPIIRRTIPNYLPTSNVASSSRIPPNPIDPSIPVKDPESSLLPIGTGIPQAPNSAPSGLLSMVLSNIRLKPHGSGNEAEEERKKKDPKGKQREM